MHKDIISCIIICSLKNERVFNSQMKNTYIDITQLVHWPGRLTGIPRVMQELSLRYAHKKNTHFVVWDKAANCFFELDTEKSLSRRGEGIFYKTSTITGSNSEIRTGLREELVDQLKQVGRLLKKYNPDLHLKIATRFNHHILGIQGPPVILNASDELFILWGEWSDKRFLNAVIEAHSSGVTLVHVVYDMLPILTPQFSGHSTCTMNVYYRSILPLCRLVLSISESTRKDLTDWLIREKLDIPRIETFRLGDDFMLAKPTSPIDRNFKDGIKKDEPYLLCVGTVEARKNHMLLYYVYKLAQSRGIDLPKLVIVGRRGWRTDDILEIMTTDPEVKEKFIFITNASDEELSWLYHHCLFTVYPSFYEGWGLPIAESIGYGKPCLASSTSSMMEIAGELLSYFNPASSEECLVGIMQLLDPMNLEAAKVKIGKYKITKWEDTYRRVAHLVESKDA